MCLPPAIFTTPRRLARVELEDLTWNPFGTMDDMNSVTTGATTVTRTHNSDNQITAIGAASGLTYDDNGNMTTDDQGRKFTWDAWNRLVLVTDSAGVIIKFYAYDGMGRSLSIWWKSLISKTRCVACHFFSTGAWNLT